MYCCSKSIMIFKHIPSRRALLLLKKKRYQEKLLCNADQQLENLERLAADIEYAQIELQVVDGLKFGNTALKNINSLLEIEDIERILDETKEGAEKQAEINSILSAVVSEEDEEDIMKELETLIESHEDIILPDVPTDDLEPHTRAKTKSPGKKVATVAE